MILYGFLIRIYWLAVRFAAIRNGKAKKFVAGRRNWRSVLKKQDLSGQVVWFHCASLGEFEQGRPLMEEMRARAPQVKILLTFFSPSGYEVRKDYSGADFICYLPIDTRRNAEDFVKLTNPALAVFVKYEVWPNYFASCKRNEVPLYMVSAIFRQDHRYFKPYGSLFRRHLQMASKFYVQNDESKELLSTIGITNVKVTGDTRFDRVKAIADQARHVESIVSFKGQQLLVVAGSTWLSEERLISQFLSTNEQPFKLIIAPHDVNAERLKAVSDRFPEALKFSEARIGEIEKAQILIIDNVGMLNRIYAQGDLAIIGGGFDKGLHNTLEAAVFGLPVIIGPNHQQFAEALALRERGAAFAIQDQDEFDMILSSLILNESMRFEASEAAKNFVEENLGSTAEIMEDVCSFLKGAD